MIHRFALSIIAACAAAQLFAAEPALDDDSAHVAELIERLGADDYFERERAQEELSRIGLEAYDRLMEAKSHVDPEIAERAAYIVRQMKVEWTTDADTPEVKRVMAEYVGQGEARRRHILSELARLPNHAGTAALARLARFEQSEALAKEAAVRLILSDEPTDEEKPTVISRINEVVRGSGRTGVQWLRRYIAELEGKPQEASWGDIAASEEQVLAKTPTESRTEIVAGLWRRQVNVLRAAGKRDEAVQAMMRLVTLESGSTETLLELFDWLVEQQAWSVVDEVERRFDDRINQNPILLYTLAHARRVQGEEGRSAQAAEKAVALNPDNPYQHLVTAGALQKRGLLEWAEREYRLAIEIGPANSRETIGAYFVLAEMLHDQERDLEAAEAYDKQIASMEMNLKANVPSVNQPFDIQTARVRANLFRGLHYGRAKDHEKEIEHLKAAFQENPEEIDTLIALYNSPATDEKLREDVKRHIGNTLQTLRDGMRGVINDDGNESGRVSRDVAVACNNFAWLVANTEGDLDEALRASQRSLELIPTDERFSETRGGYLDTLARCYYAKGDYENAVKYQKEAVRLLPNSGQIKRQLELFEKAAAEKKNAAE